MHKIVNFPFAGLAFPLSEPLQYKDVMLKALEKEDIECPEPFSPNCDGMRRCTLPADQFGKLNMNGLVNW